MVTRLLAAAIASKCTRRKVSKLRVVTTSSSTDRCGGTNKRRGSLSLRS